jgi:putative spermidine/putrescine transport system permease protein
MILALAPLLAVLLLFEVLPLSAVVLSSFSRGGSWSVGNYAELILSAYHRGAFVTSMWLSLLTTVIGMGLALPISRLLQRTPDWLQTLILTYSNIGANFTGFPLAFAFIIMFGLSGSFTLLLKAAGLIQDLNIYSIGGLVMVYAYFQVCLGILVIFPSLAAITVDVEEAALLLGVSRLTFWRRIGLPILAPSLIGAAVLLFANAMGTYATAFALAGGNVNLMTIHIGELVAGDVFSDPNLADALSMILVVTLLLPIVVEQVWFKRRRHER